VESVGGKPILRTADGSFFSRFAPGPVSGMPVLILQIRGSDFVDTTRHYPAVVRDDAALWWAAYERAQNPGREGKGGGLGLLAPWVADEYLLGKGDQAWAEVERLNSEHRLTGGNVGRQWPTGAAYVTWLRELLVQRGYCT
jgi:hypothetical protein